ncbi:MAG: NAD(P)/FAD-dependent oxidoreductase [Anaerolineales bacterium]|nr:NAD(P)/FAD-dependent oxidoreductase [Anaerolineales bacterium]
MTQNHYNAIIIGAGHNGLVAAAYLAKRGKKVLVLERRAIVGGTVVTESFGEGFAVDSVQTGGRLRPDIIKDLKLSLPAATEKSDFISLQADGNHLTLNEESIRKFSEKDASRWNEFIRFMNQCADILDVAYATIMPRLPKNLNLREGYGLLELGLELRLAGRKDMLNFIRALPMSAQELAEEYFESEVVKAAIASVAIHGSTLGPMSAGTGYTLIHNWLNRGGLALIPSPRLRLPSPSGRGVGGEGEESGVRGIGEITSALANAVKSFGGEIRTNAEVSQIKIENQSAKGIVLANGEEISADAVLSSADPKHTLLKLVGARELPPEFVWNAQSIKMRGSVAKVHLQVGGDHGIPAGTLCVAPSVKYLEKAYDAAKYGEISEKPYLEITSVPVRESAKESVVSIHFQFAPYNLKHGTWDVEREKLKDLAIHTLAEYFPNLQSLITNCRIITPKDLEETYGLTEGDINHGQLMLDQFLFMRPIPGWSNHKTPIDNLYLCGSGAHGGGGISGAAGRNAAKILV